MFNDATIKELLKALVETEHDVSKTKNETNPLVKAQKIIMRTVIAEFLTEQKEEILKRTQKKMKELKEQLRESQN